VRPKGKSNHQGLNADTSTILDAVPASVVGAEHLVFGYFWIDNCGNRKSEVSLTKQGERTDMARGKKRHVRSPKHEPPQPFHIDSGVPWYHSPSTAATDLVFRFLQRIFGKEKRN